MYGDSMPASVVLGWDVGQSLRRNYRQVRSLEEVGRFLAQGRAWGIAPVTNTA